MSNSPAIANPGEELEGSVASLDLSPFGQCLNGTAERFIAAELEGFPRERVHVRRNPFVRDDDKLPCAIISPYLLRPDPTGGTNRETAVDFLVMLSFHWAGGREAVNGMGQALAGMTEAYRLFAKKPNAWLGFTVDAGESCLRDATIDNAEALNLEAWRAGVTAQYLIIDYSLRLGYAGVN
jgi:hypothetical protein